MVTSLTIFIYTSFICTVIAKPLLFTSHKNTHMQIDSFNYYQEVRDAVDKYTSLMRQKKPTVPDIQHQPLGFQAGMRATKTVCEVCKIIVISIQVWVAAGKTESEIVELATDLCVLLRLEDKKVCTGITRAFKAEVLTVLDKLILKPDEVCGILLGDGCGSPYDPYSNWNITLPNIPKPPVHPYKPPKPGSPTVRILHLTDIHYDKDYQVGANAECGEPLCCRANSGKPAKGVPGAGMWGDYRHCDTPMWTLENMFENLRNKSDEFDMIFWTGDLPAHDVWNQTRQAQTEHIQTLTKMFQRYLPQKPVYSCLGNHESAPVNSFPPPFIKGNNSISWLYDALADSWLHWLPNSTFPTITRGAFYTVSPYPGLRIVSINTNYCNNENWWLLLNTTDPAQELQWLIDVLQSAEDKREKVYILGHIPPGIKDCLKAWSWNYYKIVNRYESTIVAQFFGHIHVDSYEVFYDDVNFTRPVSIAYITPSVTPYFNLNLGYRIFTVDGNYNGTSWAVLDHETYILNLTESNLHNTTKWQLEYSAKAAFQLKSLTPKDWSDLIYTMKNNSTLLTLFNKLYNKSVPVECDAQCRAALLCALKSGRSHDSKLCSDLLQPGMELSTAEEHKRC